MSFSRSEHVISGWPIFVKGKNNNQLIAVKLVKLLLFSFWKHGEKLLRLWVYGTFFKIRFWYLRCCGCPWNRGRQHLATPLKTCRNIEAGFLTGWLLCLSPNSEWRRLRLRRSRSWAVCLPLSPQKGDHPPSHDNNFARTSVCRWLPQKPTASQVEAARNPEKGGLYSDLPTPIIYLLTSVEETLWSRHVIV